MKKYISILLSLILVFTFVSCAKTSAENNENEYNTSSAVTDSSDEKINPNIKYSGTPGVDTNFVTSDILICYFSCTGNTAQIASYISNSTGGDTFEIIPKYPYTIEDLTFDDTNSRAYKEMMDSKSKPDFTSKVTSWESYKTVYIGYPLWYGSVPKIVYNFANQYDFSDKKVILFSVLDGEKMPHGAVNTSILPKNINWNNAKKFNKNAIEKDVTAWIKNNH